MANSVLVIHPSVGTDLVSYNDAIACRRGGSYKYDEPSFSISLDKAMSDGWGCVASATVW